MSYGKVALSRNIDSHRRRNQYSLDMSFYFAPNNLVQFELYFEEAVFLTVLLTVHKLRLV